MPVYDRRRRTALPPARGATTARPGAELSGAPHVAVLSAGYHPREALLDSSGRAGGEDPRVADRDWCSLLAGGPASDTVLPRPARPARRDPAVRRPARAARRRLRAAAGRLARAGRRAVLPRHRRRPRRVVRRRHLQTQGREVIGFDDDVLDLDALGDAERGTPQRRGRPAGRAAKRRAPAGWATSSPPSRPSRTGSSAPTCRGSWWSRAGRAPARPPWRCTGPPTCSTPTGPAGPAAACWSSGRTPSFLRYIEQVLPSLGETGVLLATPGELYPGVEAARRRPAATARSRATCGWSRCCAAAVADRQRVPGRPVELTVDGHRLRPRPGDLPAGPRRWRGAPAEPHNPARRDVRREVIAASPARWPTGSGGPRRRGADRRLGSADELDEAVRTRSPLADLAARSSRRAIRPLLDRLWPELSPSGSCRPVRLAGPARRRPRRR